MSSPSSNLPPFITRKLRILRRSLRTYVVLDGLATALLALVVVFWSDLALDRFFEFSRPLRGILLFGMLALTVTIFQWRIFRRLPTIPDDRLALVFERFVPSLGESMITAVELGDSASKERETFDPELFHQTVGKAKRELKGVDVRRFFRYGRLVGRILLSCLLFGGVVAFCANFGKTAELWFSRNVLLSDRDWPRRSLLQVEGFHDGRVRIGRGDSYTLTVRASTAMPLVPETVRLRLGNRESGYRTVLIDQFRIDTLDGTDWRTFSYTFAEMLETLPFSIRAADTNIENLEIEVVPPPVLTQVLLHQKFPPYMGRPDRTVSPGSRITIPDGTSLTIDAEASKPLKNAAAVVDREKTHSVDPRHLSTRLSYSIENLRKDTQLEFQLEDEDSLRNRQPIRFDFTVQKDQPPTVTARLDGIGNAVTPNAVLPASGELTDDYGLAASVFRYSIERGKNEEEETPAQKTDESDAEKPGDEITAAPERDTDDEGTVEIAGIGSMQTVFSLADTFSVFDGNVRPGDRLSLRVEATDRFDLDGQAGQTGIGQRWTLEIVTPERLRSLLEVREIALRQRFEVLIGEVELTKNLLEEIALDVPEAVLREAEALRHPEPEPPGGDAEENRKRREELEAKRKTLLETIAKEQTEPGRYNISRALRDTQKEVYEIRTIVESFRLIRQEMVNNRIFSDDDRDRLDRGIVDPMRELLDEDFPETDRRLTLLDETLDIRDRPLRTTAREQRKAAVEQFDLLLKKMAAIRDNMVSMESFNEVIDMLRAIIKQQQQLRLETQEEKNQRLKNLLE